MTWIAVGVTGGSALLGWLGAKKAPKQQTTSQQFQLDSFARSGVDQGLAEALNQYRQNQANGGAPLAPLSQASQQAMSTIEGGGIQAPTSSIFARGASINPYLNQLFNTSADATQNRLATEFSMSGAGGLNSPSHQQSRSQELQTLAGSIFAPGWEAERQRQYGAAEAGVNRNLDQQNLQLDRLLGVGAFQDQRAQAEADRPGANVDQLLARLGGLVPMYGGGSTTTTPLYTNPLSGAAGGALLGQALLPGMQGLLARQQQPQQPVGYAPPNTYGSPWALGGRAYG